MGIVDDEFHQYVRRYPVYDVLEKMFIESVGIFNNYDYGVKRKDVAYYSKRTNQKLGHINFDISQWIIVNICFNSIKYGNDYRSNPLDEGKIIELIDKMKRYEEYLENMENEKNYETLFKHLVVIANMEFDFERKDFIQRFNRIYHIISFINKSEKYDQTSKVNYINFDEKFKEIVGIDINVFINSYMIICLLSTIRKNANILEIIDKIGFDVNKLGFTTSDMEYIIKFQSKDYDFYKNYDNWNILKYFPIVHSKRFPDKYLIANIHALMLNFSESLYWILRNHYNDLKSRKFTSYFGHCFEFYLDDFLNNYCINHSKIDESDEKKPDWRIETTKYIIIVEQKASLMRLDTREISSPKRYEAIDSFIDSNIVKAFNQLNNYDEKTIKPIIKICLLFERTYMEELLQDFAIKRSKISDCDSYAYWISSIDEFEKLMILLAQNEKEFNKIIEKKLILEKKKDKNGRSLYQLLSSYKNEYIESKINYFKKIVDDNTKKWKIINNHNKK